MPKSTKIDFFNRLKRLKKTPPHKINNNLKFPKNLISNSENIGHKTYWECKLETIFYPSLFYGKFKRF